MAMDLLISFLLFINYNILPIVAINIVKINDTSMQKLNNILTGNKVKLQIYISHLFQFL